MGLDILIFAGVAVFLIYYLRGILGGSSGRDKLDHPFDTLRDRKQQDDDDKFDPSEYDQSKYENNQGDDSNVINLPNAKKRPPEVKFHDDADINQTIIDIRKLDAEFHPKTFVQGAEMAYEMVLNGFADGNLEELRGLMSSQVYADFKTAIDARANDGETLETTLVGFDKVKIVGATLENKTAEIDVVYQTQQINIIRGSDGQMQDEEDANVVIQNDQWTLVRKLTSKDPNWTLVSLSSLDE